LEIINCILWNNAPQDIFLGPFFDITLTHSSVNTDPLFVLGLGGCYYPSQTAAGQAQDSPCLDAGSDPAASLGLDPQTTRTDEVTDAGTVAAGRKVVQRADRVGTDSRPGIAARRDSEAG
jgi:hypothetical protein